MNATITILYAPINMLDQISKVMLKSGLAKTVTHPSLSDKTLALVGDRVEHKDPIAFTQELLSVQKYLLQLDIHITMQVK